MRKTLCCLVVCVCLSSCARDTFAQKPVTGFDLEEYPGYTLVRHDEFSQNGRPDSNHWSYEQGFVRNDELQWYQPDNARCEDGLLIIEARREQKPNPFTEPHYLIVNLAIGGTNGGDPADTAFPSLYEIDYVRVYQKKK